MLFQYERHTDVILSEIIACYSMVSSYIILLKYWNRFNNKSNQFRYFPKQAELIGAISLLFQFNKLVWFSKMS